jgi:mannose-6-phosphate isomerase-like protein (cupin superfamily)
MPKFDFVRRVQPAETFPEGRGAHPLADLERCYVVARHLPRGGRGAPLHVHPVDQVSFVVRGRQRLALGCEDVTVTRHGLAFIPANTPHETHNDGEEPELHLEIFVPPPPRGSPTATPVQSREGGAGGGFVRQLEADGWTELRDGVRAQTLIGGASGSAACNLTIVERAGGSARVPAHIQTYDQLFFVLEGTLEVEAALEPLHADADTLVVVPAGVPHRARNGDGPSRELRLFLPEPGREEVTTFEVEIGLLTPSVPLERRLPADR